MNKNDIEKDTVKQLYELKGYNFDPVTDEKWEAMDKYPAVAMADYKKISEKAMEDYEKAIQARPGYPCPVGSAELELWTTAAAMNIAAQINIKKALPFEVEYDGTCIFLPKNYGRIEGDYIVVAKNRMAF